MIKYQQRADITVMARREPIALTSEAQRRLVAQSTI